MAPVGYPMCHSSQLAKYEIRFTMGIVPKLQLAYHLVRTHNYSLVSP